LNFIIFSLARTGSTTLARVVNACAGKTVCLDEPFNPVSRVKSVPTSIAELRVEVEQIFSSNSGFKHVWHPQGWPFHAPSLNEWLLLESNARIIFLTRRNILQRVVSIQISEQVRVWHPELPDEYAAFEDHEFAPLDETRIEWHVKNEMSAIAECRSAVNASGVEWLDLSYEELFEDGLSPDQRHQRLSGVLTFIGQKQTAPVVALDEVYRRNRKINSRATYIRIPGIDRINAMLGSPVTGYLY